MTQAKVRSFVGIARMYDEDVYVNTDTGEGIGRVLERIDPLIAKMAARTFISGFRFEDLKQEIAILAIEGIRAYNPDFKVKLSTFLHTHLKYKLISRIKSENKLANDAFVGSGQQELCECGGQLIVSMGIKTCDFCNVSFRETYRRARSEIYFSQIKSSMGSEDHPEEVLFEETIQDGGGFFNQDAADEYEVIDFKASLQNASRELDQRTLEALQFIYMDGLTVNEAVRMAGLPPTSNQYLKKLSENPNFIELFREYIEKNAG